MYNGGGGGGFWVTYLLQSYEWSSLGTFFRVYVPLCTQHLVDDIPAAHPHASLSILIRSDFEMAILFLDISGKLAQVNRSLVTETTNTCQDVLNCNKTYNYLIIFYGTKWSLYVDLPSNAYSFFFYIITTI